MNLIIACALIGLIPAIIAQSKGRSFVAWWLYGAALFIFALPHALMMGRREGQGRMKCPYCAEFIHAEAVVCRFCGREIRTTSPASPISIVEPMAEPVQADAADFRSVNLPNAPRPNPPQTDPHHSLEEVQADMNGRGKARFFGVVGVLLLALIVWFAFVPGLTQKPAAVPPSQEDGPSQRSQETSASPKPVVTPNPMITPSSIDPGLVRSARRIVNAMVADGALKSINGPYSIVVGPKFFELGLPLQDAVCKAVSLMRMERHQSDGFFLKDSIDNGKIGEFSNGKLTMY